MTNLGDASPLEHGGYFVYEDETGVYAPEAELLLEPSDDFDIDDPKARWTVYRFSLDRCTYENGVLSENKFHPDFAAWFAKLESERAERPQDTTYLKNVADCNGMEVEEMIRLFISDSPVERAHGYRAVGEYHGFDNLDSYPNTYTKAEIEARYTDGELKRKRS